MNIVENFKSYWLNVIKVWNERKIHSTENNVWFKDNVTGLYKVYMPEPYWGDPEHCSMVFLNFNPGGSNEEDSSVYCHVSQKENKDSFVNYILQNPKALSEFPWYNLKVCPEHIFKQCEGSIKWIQRRKEWLESLIQPIVKTDNIPFFLEVCAWHSKNWKNVIFDDTKIKYLKEHLLPILVYSIKNSDLGIGMCVGKQFATTILPCMGFKPLSDPEQPGSTKRYYQWFEYDGAKILCTYSGAGFNKPSASTYRNYEISTIRKYCK